MKQASPEQPQGAPPELPADQLSVGTVKAAQMLGISRRMLMELIYSGEIKSSKIPSIRSGKPNMHLIEVDELKAFLKRSRT